MGDPPRLFLAAGEKPQGSCFSVKQVSMLHRLGSRGQEGTCIYHCFLQPCVLVQATVTDHHRLGYLKQQKFISDSAGG